jgi:hypothetical protein
MLARLFGLSWISQDYEMVPIIGIELMTYRLQGGCSTN